MFDTVGDLRVLLDTCVTSRKYELDREKAAGDVVFYQRKDERDVTFLTTGDSKDEEQGKSVGWLKKT